jgi:nucleoside-diphosphate-sugar epimerase
MYVDDCIEGIYRIMRSDYSSPLNLGTDELVSVDELVDIISEIAGKSVTKRHDISKPQGVRGRNSDNSRLRTVLGWEPKTPLRQGLVPTYRWIEERVASEHGFSGMRPNSHSDSLAGRQGARPVRTQRKQETVWQTKV